MNINEVISYCGLMCSSCPIFWATMEKDSLKQIKMREKIAEICNTYYGLNYTHKDITDCDGCRAKTGRAFASCVNCEIKKCAVEKKYNSCAECQDYICSKLQKLFDTEASAKNWLEIIRSIS